MAGRTWIFDLDDTLIYNSYNYTNAIASLILYILQKRKNEKYTGLEKEIEIMNDAKKEIVDLKLSPEDLIFYLRQNNSDKALEIADKFYETDIKYMNRLKRNKFNRKRFPTVCSKVYEFYFPKNSKNEKKKAYEIGKSTFSGDSPYKEGAEEVLSFLKSKKDNLVLLTKGDKEIQRKKIGSRNLEKWFGNHIYIFEDKSPFVFQRVLDSEKIPPSKKVYSVGNHFKSDIESALDIGLSGVYFPERRWVFEKVNNFRNFEVIKKLSELKERYSEITNNFK